MVPQASKKFGRYEIVGELGRGAMGIVYKARDPQIGRMVAVKTVLLRGQEPEEEQDFRKRFMGEAQAAGRLHHPGIVAIYDVGEDSENHDPYLVLEFVNGESLNRVLAREKKLPLARALQLAQEIAEALDYAHAQGVVHRDIKPANILLTEEGRAKIADLGIAQLNLAHFTLPGRVLGTPAYMAPEQLSGEGCDGRSDLFSLGVILYAMVTGHSPFHGNSATTVCFKVVNRDPMPASALDMGLPPALDAVIAKAMAKDPAKRYQRGSEFAEDVRRLASPHGETSAWIQTRSGTGGATVTADHAAVKPNAVAGVLHAEEIIRTAVQKASPKHLIIAGALVVLFLIVAIPTRKALTSQNATLANKVEPQPTAATAQPNKNALTQRPGSAPASGITSAKPRESIVEEMQVDDSPAASVPPPPVRSSKSSVKAPAKPAVKPAPKLVLAKARSLASSAAPPTTAPPAVKPATATKPAPVATSTLELSVEHQFEAATLSVWVDNQLVLTRPLHGGSQKKLVVFKGFHGLDQESLKVAAGSHELHLRAQTSDQSIDLFKTMTADFAPGEDKTLQVTFDKHNTEMRLAWRPVAAQ